MIRNSEHRAAETDQLQVIWSAKNQIQDFKASNKKDLTGVAFSSARFKHKMSEI